jgi:uncharacterized membrane protein
MEVPQMVLAAFGDGLYKLLYLGHIVAFLVAFAPAVIHPILAAQAKGDGPDTLPRLSGHMAANGRRIHLPALVAVGGLGLAMVLVSDEVWGFDQAWVSLAFLVWLAIGGVVTAILLPAERRLAGGDLAAEKQVAVGGQITTLLLLAMLYLMIWKPGA